MLFASLRKGEIERDEKEYTSTARRLWTYLCCIVHIVYMYASGVLAKGNHSFVCKVCSTRRDEDRSLQLDVRNSRPDVAG